ncbi:unnamed protein product [Closterium sp. NIES-53]
MSHLDSVGVDINRVSGVGTDGASVMTGDKGGLVSRLRERVPHLVGCHCVAHREALVVKDAAKAFPDLNMIDEGVRAIGEIICRSNIWYERFKELQQEMHKTNLEHQGLFNNRWLSRGDAIARLCRVDITQVAKEVDRTITIITHRYIEYGETFGGGVSNQLSRFIKDHGGENRTLVVEGIDGDGRPTSHRFELSENPIKKHKFGGTFADCVKLCTGFANEILARMKFRMWDLQQMGGAKLFKVESWPSREDQRDIKCLDWLAQIDELFGGVLPVECERGFSRQNIIKSWMRTSLCDARLGDLMTLHMLKYPYVWPDVVDIWRKQKSRRPAKSVAQAIPVSRKGKEKVPEPEDESENEQHTFGIFDDDD